MNVSSPALTDEKQSRLEVREPEPAGGSRFRSIDALRGIAAAYVLVFHVFGFGLLLEQAGHFIPAWIMWICAHGFIGVAIFFVLSGFVMAYSQRNVRITPQYLMYFAIRRSLRLDPPYWTALVLYLILAGAAKRMLPGFGGWFPSKSDILYNLVYLQDLVGRRAIVPVAWTLCLEVQFYLVLTIIKGIGQKLRLGRDEQPLRDSVKNLWLLGVIGLVALPTTVWGSPFIDATFLPLWPLFFLGALVWWAVADNISVLWLIAYAPLVCAAVFAKKTDGYLKEWWHWSVVTAIVVAAIIYLLVRFKHLDRWLDFKVVQFLGRISYSLYLVHILVITWGFGLTKRITHNQITPRVAVLTGLIDIVISVLAGWLIYRFVERPGVSLGKKLKHHIGRADT